MNILRSFYIAVAAVLLCGGFAAAQEPDWAGRVLKGDQRDEINAMAVEERPYRPFHFYGNTVRRRYYRGVGLPLPRDLFFTANALVRER